jgi:hypothetical protein
MRPFGKTRISLLLFILKLVFDSLFLFRNSYFPAFIDFETAEETQMPFPIKNSVFTQVDEFILQPFLNIFNFFYNEL